MWLVGNGPMKLKQITGLVRLINPHYPTNLAILVVATAVGLIGFIVQLVMGSGFWQAFGWSFAAGFLTIMSWAISRELDPDHDLSAFVSVVLFLITLFFYEIYAFVWPTLLVIIALRIVNRSNGLTATWLDSIFITIFSGWLVASTGHWEYGVVAALALLLDAFLPVPSRRQLLFAGVVVLVTLFWQWTSISDKAIEPFPVAEWIAGGVTAVLFISLIILRSNHIRSLDDATKQPLIPRRVQAAQVLAVVIGFLSLWQGGDKLLALWSAMLGVSLYRIYTITRGNK
jgi:hypothetical protein